MKIAFLISAVGLLGCAMSTDAQIVPYVPARQAIVNSTMLFEDRGQQLEVYPALRATPEVVAGAPGVLHKLAVADERAPISPRHLGVVYNHALQTQAFLTGEIAFKPTGDGAPVGFDAASYPGLAKLTNPNTYVVVASSPGEFLALLNRLKSRADLEWVEAVVIYGAAASQSPLKPSPRPDSKAPR